MKRAVVITLLAAIAWLFFGTWYYDCKIKRVCGPDEDEVKPVAAAEPSPVSAPATVAPAPVANTTPAQELAATKPAAPVSLAGPEPILVLTVSFDARSAAIQPPADAAEKVALLKRGVAEGKKILVLGHSDGSGARVRIGIVSQQRADTLRDWLLTQGIAANAISAVESREDRNPIASNSRAEGRAKNRRAEALLIPAP